MLSGAMLRCAVLRHSDVLVFRLAYGVSWTPAQQQAVMQKLVVS